MPEFQDEGNNATVASLPIILRTPPDLRVSAVASPEHATVGQSLTFSYTVTNNGGATTPHQSSWSDSVYLSRDPYLDTNADRYLGTYDHSGGLAAGANYSISDSLRLPRDLIGPYYLFVVTDPYSSAGRSAVYEGVHEQNNAAPSAQPVLLELPPPSDLLWTRSPARRRGRWASSIQISWTVQNQGANSAEGSWSDAVYLSDDSLWDINDRLLGRVSFTGTLEMETSIRRR